MPRPLYRVAKRSATEHGSDVTSLPSLLVEPWTRPPFMAPPPTTTDQQQAGVFAAQIEDLFAAPVGHQVKSLAVNLSVSHGCVGMLLLFVLIQVLDKAVAEVFFHFIKELLPTANAEFVDATRRLNIGG